MATRPRRVVTPSEAGATDAAHTAYRLNLSMDRLARRIRAFVADHPRGRCRCRFCTYLDQEGGGWPSYWSELEAVAVVLNTTGGAAGSDRPMCDREVRATLRGLELPPPAEPVIVGE